MELRHFWNIIRRRWWVVALVFVLAAAYGLYQWKAGGNVYDAQIRLVVRQTIAPNEATIGATAPYTYDSYYRYFSSEYLVDDYDEIVKGRTFADAVAATMKADPTRYGTTPLNGDKVYGLVGASRIHRVMTIDVNSNDPAVSLAVASAVSDTLVTQGGTFLPPAVRDDVSFVMIDYPKDPSEAKSNASKKLTTGVIIVLLGFIIGLALAFLLEYLDDRIRDVGDAQRVTDLPVIGRVPNKGTLP